MIESTETGVKTNATLDSTEIKKGPSSSRPMIGGRKPEKPKNTYMNPDPIQSVRPAATYGLNNSIHTQKPLRNDSMVNARTVLDSRRNSSSKNNIEEEELEDENSVKQGSYMGGPVGVGTKSSSVNAITEKTVSDNANEPFRLDNERYNNMTSSVIERGKKRPKSKTKSDQSKYSAVVFTVPKEQ